MRSPKLTVGITVARSIQGNSISGTWLWLHFQPSASISLQFVRESCDLIAYQVVPNLAKVCLG